MIKIRIPRNQMVLWLAVVIASVARNQSSLAIGNDVGATTSNILGAFSLGLLFYSTSQKIPLGRNSKRTSFFYLS